MNANEAFEQEAELFYRDTGFLAPGKSESPAAMGQTDFERYEVRQLLKRAWDAGRRRPEPPRRYPKGSVVPEWNHYCADGHEPVASMGDRCPVCRRDADGKVSEPPRREAEDARRMQDLHDSACGCLDFRRTLLCMAVYKFISALPSPAEAGEKPLDFRERVRAYGPAANVPAAPSDAKAGERP
jgi:hypothetical protein